MNRFGCLRGWLAFALLLLPMLAVADVPPPSHWKADIAAFVAHDRSNPPPQHGVLFIGSSSIRFWAPTLASDFPGVPVIDRGFGGSAIADSTAYAGQIAVPYRPRLIVMYAGDNDIAEGHTPGQVVDDFKAFVARVRRDLPGVPVAWISIKPSTARWNVWSQMRAANAGVQRWAATQKDVSYVDVASKMLDAQGKPRPGLLRADGLHMRPAGYAIWIKALDPVLARYGFRPAQAASATPAASAAK